LDRSLEWCENQILNDLPNDGLKAQPLEVQMKMIFSDVSQVQQFIKYLECKKIPKDYVLFRKDDPSDGLYFLESGQIFVV